MPREKLSIENESGQKLAAVLELPVGRKPHNYSIFAHCFTCSKNFKAVRNISSALATKGFGVLSLDFTGLGESEGDFKDTNFSSSVGDLLSAAAYLKENHVAARLLVGHSLGGTTALMAADSLPEIAGIATIGSPSMPDHVKRLFSSEIENIRKAGYADVSIGGQSFRLKKQFIDDVESQDISKALSAGERAYLFLHSPQDQIVSIDNAAELYKAARHPKSFISLDGADHLLTDEEDACYTGSVIAAWAERYVSIPEPPALSTDSHTVAYLAKADKFTTHVMADKHRFIADEPEGFGGDDLGPSPYQLISSGLAACTVMTLRLYADRKGWDLQEVFCHIRHEKVHLEDCVDCDNPKARIDKFTRELELIGDLDDGQKTRMMEIADKCPVHKTLEGIANIETRLLR
ncbi:MAG TPA: bifunctional alpha/beta hydrolase/OsmC family protein [Aridibacter sp.]|nr:bifunctional alpha/beta hydrolase/OsmC family protein [Aridibacter sp.]